MRSTPSRFQTTPPRPSGLQSKRFLPVLLQVANNPVAKGSRLAPRMGSARFPVTRPPRSDLGVLMRPPDARSILLCRWSVWYRPTSRKSFGLRGLKICADQLHVETDDVPAPATLWMTNGPARLGVHGEIRVLPRGAPDTVPAIHAGSWASGSAPGSGSLREPRIR